MSDELVNRLRGKYAKGPILENGEPEFGYRQFDNLPVIHGEAAAEIERLRAELAVARDLLKDANCGTCGNSGSFAGGENGEQQQCEWCWHRDAAIAGEPT